MMKSIKTRRMTTEEIQSILNSPTIIRKKKEAEQLFHSAEFKTHIQKRTAERKESSVIPSLLKKKLVVKKKVSLSRGNKRQVA
jgi:hypothetical protein